MRMKEKSLNDTTTLQLNGLQRAIGLLGMAAGIAILVAILVAVNQAGTKAAALGNGPGAAMFQLVFVLHVPLILSLLLIPGGIGIFLQRTWAWSLVQIPAFVLVVMSIQLVLSMLDTSKLNSLVMDNLVWVLLLQSAMVAILVLLNGKSVREVLRVKMPDIWMAALFACVLLLDWLVSLYNALATNA